MENFFNALAWILGVLSVLLVLARIGGWYYTNHTAQGQIEEKVQQLTQGLRSSYDFRLPGFIAIVSWTWIIFK